MFSYNNLLDEVQRFCKRGVETGIVGESELGQQIPYVFVGKKNGNYMIVQGAIHAREHLTALVTVCLAKYLVANPSLRLDGGIYFVPMVNPDGVRLCQEGVNWLEGNRRAVNLQEINGGDDFTLWKANAEGVDLNVNFDAKWGEGEQNVFSAAPQNYVGAEPFSAAESRVLADFTTRIKPVVTLSYHLKGEEVYYEFFQNTRRLKRDKRYAEAISSYTGYPVKTVNGSAGGYKDWCIDKLHIPSYTIEVGADEFPHPFPYSQLSAIVAQNEDLPRRLLNTVVRDKKRISQAVDYDKYFE